MCERLWKCKHFVIEEFVVFDESGEPCDEALEYYCNKRDDYITPSCCERCNDFEEEE